MAVFFVDGVGEDDIFPVTCRPRLFSVLEYFACTAVYGDVEVFAVVVATTIPAVINVTFIVNIEVSTHLSTNSHVESLVKGWVHGKSVLDVDKTILFLFGQLSFFNRLGFVEIEMRPFGCHAVAPHVHRGVVGIGLLRVFLLLTLRCSYIACLNRRKHQSGNNECHKGLGSHG